MTQTYAQAIDQLNQLLADIRNGLPFEEAYNRYMGIKVTK